MLTAVYKNGQVRTTKFLSISELEYIKKLRADCALFNKSSACFSSDSRSKYVVINDRIMERLNSGKLAPYYNSVNSKLIVSSNLLLQTENGQSSNNLQQQPQQQGLTCTSSQPKKRLCGEPCGSLTISAFVNAAAAQASFIDPADTQSRNDVLNTQSHNKKCISWGPCGSLSAIFQAASCPSEINDTDVHNRNAKLNKQLALKGLTSINVSGDGNCLFHALSVSFYGHKFNYSFLRSTVAQHILDHAACVATKDAKACRKLANTVAQEGRWVGEDVLPFAAICLKVDIQLYLAIDSMSPILYSSGLPGCTTVMTAFYESGHYNTLKTVSKKNPANNVMGNQRLNYMNP